jgi:chaperonin GroEL
MAMMRCDGSRQGEGPMTAKQVLFHSAARDKILRGASQFADAVRVSLGPRSKSALIQRKWGVPIVCNDGVTIVSGRGK